MKQPTAVQIEEFRDYAEDGNLSERTRRWFRLLIKSSENGLLTHADGNGKARRFIKNARKSADPAKLIFAKSKDGRYEQLRLEAAISRLPVETMYLSEVALELQIAAEKVVPLLNGRLTRGCIDRMAKGCSVTIAGFYFGLTVKLAVIQIVDERNVPNKSNLNAGQLFFGSTTPPFAIGQAGIQTADLVKLETALAQVPARMLGYQPTAAEAAAVEQGQIEKLRLALLAKCIDRSVPSRARTFCLIEYSGRSEFRRQIEDLVISEITPLIEVVRSDFGYRLLTGMAHHDLLRLGVGYFPDLPWWCQMLNAKAHDASAPFWEVRPALEDLAVLWERNRVRIRAAHSETKLFSGRDSSEKDSRNTVPRTPLFPEHVGSDRLSRRFKDFTLGGKGSRDGVQILSGKLIIETSAVLEAAHHGICGPEFANEIIHVRDFVWKSERNGMGPNTLVPWLKDPHKTREGLLRTTNRSQFLRQLAVGLALTQFSEKFIVGTSADDEKQCFAEFLSRLRIVIAAEIESNSPARAEGPDRDNGGKFAAKKAHEVLLIVLRRARESFQQALAVASPKWLSLAITGKISSQIIPPDSPLRSFCPPAFEVSITALLADFSPPSPQKKPDEVSRDKTLKTGGKDTFGDLLSATPDSDNGDEGGEAEGGCDDQNMCGTLRAQGALEPDMLLNIIDRLRNAQKYPGAPEQWLPDVDLRWDLTEAAIGTVRNFCGDECEISEFLSDLPKIIREEAEYRLSRRSIYL